MSDPPPQRPSDGGITIRIHHKHLWGLTGILAGLAIGFFAGRGSVEGPQVVLYGGGATGSAAASDVPAGPVDVATDGRPALGPADAKVTVVEFVDFECPFCGRYARDTFPKLVREYGSRIRYVSRHFPLPIHEHAIPVAIAAECAFRQDRYWEFHRAVFADQEHLESGGVRTAARRAGLDPGRFQSCRREPSVRAAVERDLADGRRYGVQATPTFFVNGQLLRGAQPFATFKAVIDAALRD